MLTKVEVYNQQAGTLSLPLENILNGFLVVDIDGLDPVKAALVSSQFAQIDGTQYQNSSRDNRNVILTLGIEPDYATTDVRTLRSQLYKYLMPKASVRLQFYLDDTHFVDIEGRVESFETSLFSREPEVKVSILCFDPDFLVPSSVVVSGNTVADTTEQVITYPGTVETGFIFKLAVNRTLSTFTIYNAAPIGESFSMEVAGSFLAGDVITISTVPRLKYAQLTRGGTTTPILYAISPSATWMALYYGDNRVRVQAAGAAIPYTIEYQARYGGL